MATKVADFLLFFIPLSSSIFLVFSASVLEDLSMLHPPPDFNSTIRNNCASNPLLRYCTSSPMDFYEIFKFTVVASHLCNESKNPNCVEAFPKINLRSRPKLALLYLSFDFFWKFCPLDILTIDVSNNSLKGTFPTNVFFCTQIKALDLSHNELTGDVPIRGFTTLTNLTLLNLSYNHFTESKLSNSQFLKRFNSSSFLHSGLLPNHHEFRIKAMLLLVVLPVTVITLVGCLGWLCLWRPDFLPRVLQRKHRFTPSMLKAATSGFSRKNLVEKTDGVDIYKGTIGDGSDVRIEIYRDRNSREEQRVLVDECKVLVRLCHKNIVRVLGWCDNRRMRGIVTEWTDGENVEMWLSVSAPPWKDRIRILMGVLKGMCYLQEEWPEIEYDLRTTSLLMSNNEPLISRFRFGDHYRSSTEVQKFGVLLLEMITNMRPWEEFDQGEVSFVKFIRKRYPNNLQQVMDQRMTMTEDMYEQAKQGIGLGLLCTDRSTTRLPSIGQLLNIITGVYETCHVMASSSHRRPPTYKGHKSIQSR